MADEKNTGEKNAHPPGRRRSLISAAAVLVVLLTIVLVNSFSDPGDSEASPNPNPKANTQPQDSEPSAASTNSTHPQPSARPRHEKAEPAPDDEQIPTAERRREKAKELIMSVVDKKLKLTEKNRGLALASTLLDMREDAEKAFAEIQEKKSAGTQLSDADREAELLLEEVFRLLDEVRDENEDEDL